MASVSLSWGRVASVDSVLDGLERVHVSVNGSLRPALSYPLFVGRLEEGMGVLVNTTATELSLGTGGVDFVVAALGTGLAQEADGHLMKLRYTPLQMKVFGPEDPAHPDHEAMEKAQDIGRMAVACCGLHSQLAPVAAAFRLRRPGGRLAVLMTDQGSLMVKMSSQIAALKSLGLADVVISCGQAVGGDYEAVNVYSGLLMARHVLGAEAAVVSIGPGLLGTGTPFGHGGVSQGEALFAVHVLGGRPVVVLRASGADARARHRGLSHHTQTVLRRMARFAVLCPYPPQAEGEAWLREARADPKLAHCRFARFVPGRWQALLEDVPVRSMGRGPKDDPLFFAAAAAAGRALGDLAEDDEEA